jgi:hypothetical protein
MNIEEKEDWDYLYSKMKNEGFHYCFIHYSSFEEIKDKEFHKLRKRYIKIANELKKYVELKHSEEIDY